MAVVRTNKEKSWLNRFLGFLDMTLRAIITNIIVMPISIM